jgi:pectin methylesterase-like acyl-CoA thioesterase
MNFKKFLGTSVFTVLALFILSLSATAATLTVDDDHAQCPSATFTSIQAAVTAANPNDKINVCPGTYHEQVVIKQWRSIQSRHHE